MKWPSIEAKQMNRILLMLAVLLFGYTYWKAYSIAITWDEAFSWMAYVRNGIVLPKKFEAMDANNHILNTWLSIRFCKWFGVSEFVLRIPSLIAHLVFLWASWRLVKNFGDQWLVLSAFLVLNLNPYMIDFFSLSRGYGLSLGLMMASITFLHSFITRGLRYRYAILVLVFAAIGSLANFVILNYFIVATGLVFLLLVGKLRKPGGRDVMGLAILVLIVVYGLWKMLPVTFGLREAGALFYGGKNGFWADTFSTIVDRSFYGMGYSNWFQRAVKGFVILMCVGAAGYAMWKLIRKQASGQTKFIGAMVFLLAFCVLSTIVQHKVLGTLYLMDRTALFLVVLFSVLLVFFVAELSELDKRWSFISLGAAFAMVFHFVICFNLTYVFEWKSNADVKQMIADLERIREMKKEKPTINLCIPLSFDCSTNYYRAVKHLDWLNTVERSKAIDTRFDYFYSEPEQYVTADLSQLEVLRTYPVTNNILGRPRKRPSFSKEEMHQTLFPIDPLIGPKIEYSQGFQYKVNDSITPSRNAELVLTAIVNAPDLQNNDLYLIMSFERNGQPYEWKRISIKDQISRGNEWTQICYTFFAPGECAEGDDIKAYIWNPNGHVLHMKQLDLKWLAEN